MDRETLEQQSSQVSRTIVTEVAETGEPVVTTNAQADPRFHAQESVVSYSLRSILCVPVVNKVGKVIGQAQDRHDLRGGGNNKVVFSWEPIKSTTKTNDDLSQCSIIHIDIARPVGPPNINLWLVVSMNIVVKHC